MQGTGGKEGSAEDQMLETGSLICERTGIVTMCVLDFPGGVAAKNPPASAGDMGLISGPGRLEKASAKQRRPKAAKINIK